MKNLEALVSKVLMSSARENENRIMQEECARAVSLGGAFTIEQRYIDNWYNIYTIYYPEGMSSQSFESPKHQKN